MKKVSLQGRASQWVIIFEDFSSSYGGFGHDLEPVPPFLGRVIHGADTGRVTVRYQRVNGVEVERRVNRACCSTKVWSSKHECEKAALRAAELISSTERNSEE